MLKDNQIHWVIVSQDYLSENYMNTFFFLIFFFEICSNENKKDWIKESTIRWSTTQVSFSDMKGEIQDNQLNLTYSEKNDIVKLKVWNEIKWKWKPLLYFVDYSSSFVVEEEEHQSKFVV